MRKTEDILQLYRKQKQLKHEEIAEKLGITRVHLTNVLNGKRNTKNDLLEKIMDILEVSYEDREQIKIYEEYKTASRPFRDRYEAMEKRLIFLEKKFLEIEDLRELDEILEDFYQKRILKKETR